MHSHPQARKAMDLSEIAVFRQTFIHTIVCPNSMVWKQIFRAWKSSYVFGSISFADNMVLRACLQAGQLYRVSFGLVLLYLTPL